ncbi:bifunctional metallophosphatase/5'-nucleotidase [Halovenus amylolytica]|uniref:bifunctional metallophosphatase/5'-nucleotidase n=1 Tax=Halovenus amylolytica TaxID=2500550 RepID=UPI003D6B84DC
MAVRLLHYSDLETALDDPDQCGSLAGALHASRDDGTLVVGSGDNTAPSALSLATEGGCAHEFFDAVDPDCETFGNHDFDFGADRAGELAAGTDHWLCANATVAGEQFAPEATEPNRLVEVDGTLVGIIGVAHPETDSINPKAEAVEFSDPVRIIREQASSLRGAGAEYIVVASHCGHGDERIARETSVDAVLGGHVHDVHAELIEGTAVVRPGRAGERFSEVLLGDSTEIAIHEVDDQPVDEGVRDELVDRVQALLAEHGLDEVVATAEDPIERTEETATVAESRVGNLVVDAMRWKTGADVALSPPGAIRSGPPLGDDVTVADLIALTPYDDQLAVVELSGERLREAFVAVPFGYYNDGYPNRHCSHVSGARIVWDDSSGELRDATVAGEPIDDDRRYTIAVADYLVETSHVNDAFDEADVIGRYGLARDAIVEYAREVGLDPTLDGRIQRPSLA